MVDEQKRQPRSCMAEGCPSLRARKRKLRLSGFIPTASAPGFARLARLLCSSRDVQDRVAKAGRCRGHPQRPPRPLVVRSGHPRLSWGNCSLSCHSPTPRLPCFRWRRTTWIFSKRISTVERALQRPPRPSVVRSGHPRLSWGNFSPKPRELQLALKLTF